MEATTPKREPKMMILSQHDSSLHVSKYTFPLFPEQGETKS